MKTNTVIEVRGLCRAYGPVEAVRGLDLRVQRGEVYAFLGPNGAGKTTTVEILEGFRTATAGDVRVLGREPAHAPAAWRDRIGIMLQESASDPGLTVRETLELYAGYHTRPRAVTETLALVGLASEARRSGAELSGGQQRRLDLALAIIGDPDLIFLDEPTTGFDPAARRAAWDTLDELRALGRTIFLTTHSLDEAERLADRIGVIVDGRIVAEGTPRTLGGRDRDGATISFALPAGLRTSDLPADLHVRLAVRDRRMTLTSRHPLDDLERLAVWARTHDTSLADLEVRRASLEDVYLRLTAASVA
jgi:ABC-2 type transport system ATP-binding protein